MQRKSYLCLPVIYLPVALLMVAALLTACYNADKAFLVREKDFLDSLNKLYILDTIIAYDELYDFDRGTRKVKYIRSINFFSPLKNAEISNDQCSKIGEKYFREVALCDSLKYLYMDVNYRTTVGESGGNYVPNE